MGHDVYAYRVSSQERERMHDEFSAASRDLKSTEWLDAYDDYSKKVDVAYLRRSAGNPFNTVIYQALDAMDLYGGCSGIGETRTFTRAQIVAGLESLPGIPAERPHNFADGLMGMLRASGHDVVSGGGPLKADVAPGDLDPEYKFLRAILKWMDDEKRDSIEICFG